MGMFDWLTCEYELPDEEMQGEESWQTKDFDCLMDRYVIKADGSLWIQPSRIADSSNKDISERQLDWTCTFRFYGYGSTVKEWYEYEVVFVDGQLRSLERATEHFKHPDILKEAAATMNRLAKLLSGECMECIHCGQPVKEVKQGERSVYVKKEDDLRCINSVESSPDGKSFYCRQFQGQLPNGNDLPTYPDEHRWIHGDDNEAS